MKSNTPPVYALPPVYPRSNEDIDDTLVNQVVRSPTHVDIGKDAICYMYSKDSAGKIINVVRIDSSDDGDKREIGQGLFSSSKVLGTEEI